MLIWVYQFGNDSCKSLEVKPTNRRWLTRIVTLLGKRRIIECVHTSIHLSLTFTIKDTVTLHNTYLLCHIYWTPYGI